MRPRSRAGQQLSVLLLAVAVALGLGACGAPSGPSAGGLDSPDDRGVVRAEPVAQPTPARAATPQRWRRDVNRVMKGSGAYLGRRAERAEPGVRLAVNLDVDNTMLASTYDPGAAVRPVLRFTRRAQREGVAVLVNTARGQESLAKTRRQLRRAGYVVDGLCLRAPDLGVVEGKQACRAGYRDRGYRLVANVGNRSTDFVRAQGEAGWGRTFDLPDYGNTLG